MTIQLFVKSKDTITIPKHIALYITALLAITIACVTKFDYMPLWDGFENVEHCYMASMNEFSWSCFGHSATVNNVIFSTLFTIFSPEVKLLYIVNLLFLAVAILGMYLVVRQLYPHQPKTHAMAVGVLFGVNPILLAHVVQPSLDFLIPIFATFLVLFLLKKQYLKAAFAGLLMSFCKETGFMAFGVIGGIFAILHIAEKPIAIRTLAKKLYLLLPIIAFLAYSKLNDLHAQMGGEFTDLLKEMFMFNPTNSFFVAQFKSIAVINFIWLLTGISMLGIALDSNRILRAFSYSYKHKTSLSNFFSNFPKWYQAIRIDIFLYMSYACILWFLTRVEFVNNPRYMLPLLPLIVLVFARTCFKYIPTKYRLFCFISCLFLVGISSIRTIDPVSKLVFPTVAIGRHELLDTRINPYSTLRDQIIYNLEHVYLERLPTRAIQTFGLDKNYVFSDEVHWGGYHHYHRFSGPNHQSFKGQDSEIRIKSVSDALKNDNLQKFYFVALPNTNVAKDTKSLLYKYVITQLHTVEHHGYEARVYVFTKKESNT